MNFFLFCFISLQVCYWNAFHRIMAISQFICSNKLHLVCIHFWLEDAKKRKMERTPRWQWYWNVWLVSQLIKIDLNKLILTSLNHIWTTHSHDNLISPNCDHFLCTFFFAFSLLNTVLCSHSDNINQWSTLNWNGETMQKNFNLHIFSHHLLTVWIFLRFIHRITYLHLQRIYFEF